MKKENIEILKQTLEFAVKAHEEQKTPYGFPYLYHLISVEHEVIYGMKDDSMKKYRKVYHSISNTLGLK